MLASPWKIGMLVLPLLVVVPALAAGGGGGGGGSFPSESTPQYDPAAEYQKGVAALRAQNFKAAKTAFDHVLPFTPKDANTLYLAGLSRSGLGDWKGARKFYEKAIKFDASKIAAHRELGVALGKLGDKPAAEAELAALQARKTVCGDHCPDSAELKAAVDAISAALSASPQAFRVTPSSLLFANVSDGDARYLQAVSLINEGRYDAAIETLKASQQSFGPHPDILTYLGYANRKMKRFDVAESYYKAALEVDPHHRGATEYYGELMVERSQLADARKMLARLDRQCSFGCFEAEELRRWIAAGHSPHSS